MNVPPALAFIRASVTQGLSGNQAYRDYRAQFPARAPEAMRRQDFLRLYSETVGLRGQATAAISAPKNVPHGGLVPQQRGSRYAEPGSYGYWVGVYQRTIGTSDYLHTPFLVKSNEPMTPEQAEQQVLDWLQQEPDQYNRTTLGVGFLGVEQFYRRP